MFDKLQNDQTFMFIMQCNDADLNYVFKEYIIEYIKYGGHCNFFLVRMTTLVVYKLKNVFDYEMQH